MSNFTHLQYPRKNSGKKLYVLKGKYEKDNNFWEMCCIDIKSEIKTWLKVIKIITVLED